MRGRSFPVIILLSFMAFLLPVSSYAVQTTAGDKKEIKEEEKKLDGLSLMAHMTIVVGLVSLFLLPGASLVLMPVGFILGLIAFFGRKKRWEKRRGKGLAFAAFILGGTYTLFIVTSLLALAIFGF